MMTNIAKTVLYTGMTSNLLKRVYEHKNHLKGEFTDEYNCEFLVYYEETNDFHVAVEREKQIKNWSRKKKDFLVNQMNPRWRDLAKDWYS